MRRARPEQQIQRAVFQHIKARGVPGLFAFHPANGGYRKPKEAAIFKGLGVVAGVPDVILIRGGQVFALELKPVGGDLTAAQRDTHLAMRAAGVTVFTAHGLDMALAWLEETGLLRGRADLAA